MCKLIAKHNFDSGGTRPQWDGVNITGYVYDYMIKDHLGNVRMLLTDEKKTDMYPAATMEVVSITAEETYYTNLSNTQADKPAWFTDPNYPANAKVARLKNEAGSQKIGPNILLKVMAGDSYNVRVTAGWESGTASNSSTNVLNDLLSILSTSVAGQSGGKVAAGDLQAGGSGLNSTLTSFLGTQTTAGSKPKAYLNWILLDEQFKVVSGSNGFIQVGASGSAMPLTQTGLTVPKSGYLYIYTSNEATNIDVFFDNLQVTHIRGPILEETHYYPFGLTMAGISSKALAFGQTKNRLKFTTQELNDDLGLNWYEFRFRMHDPQIGRFLTIDPLADQYVYNSTYAYAENQVINAIDLEGLEKYVVTRYLNRDGQANEVYLDYVTDKDGNVLDNKFYENNKEIQNRNVLIISYDVNGNMTLGYADELTEEQKTLMNNYNTNSEEWSRQNSIIKKDASKGYEKENWYAVGSNLTGTHSTSHIQMNTNIDLNFRSNSDRYINNSERNKLRPLAQIMGDFKNATIVLTGNGGTDPGNPQQQPLGSGPRAMNQEAVLNGNTTTLRRLLEARAAQARTTLINSYNIESGRISTRAGALLNNPSGRNVNVKIQNIGL